MVICDLCKDIKKKTKEFKIITQTPKTKKVEKTEKKPVRQMRQMVKIEMALCEDCIDIMHKKLGYWIQEIRGQS